jgi:hypothetical protein
MWATFKTSNDDTGDQMRDLEKIRQTGLITDEGIKRLKDATIKGPEPAFLDLARSIEKSFPNKFTTWYRAALEEKDQKKLRNRNSRTEVMRRWDQFRSGSRGLGYVFGKMFEAFLKYSGGGGS